MMNARFIAILLINFYTSIGLASVFVDDGSTKIAAGGHPFVSYTPLTPTTLSVAATIKF